MKFESSVELNERYRDEDTDFEGVATRVTFSRNGPARVELRALISSVPVEHWFDEAQLTFIGPHAKVLGFADVPVTNGQLGQ